MKDDCIYYRKKALGTPKEIFQALDKAFKLVKKYKKMEIDYKKLKCKSEGIVYDDYYP
jgi:hypothetical protein